MSILYLIIHLILSINYVLCIEQQPNIKYLFRLYCLTSAFILSLHSTANKKLLSERLLDILYIFDAVIVNTLSFHHSVSFLWTIKKIIRKIWLPGVTILFINIILVVIPFIENLITEINILQWWIIWMMIGIEKRVAKWGSWKGKMLQERERDVKGRGGGDR